MQYKLRRCRAAARVKIRREPGYRPRAVLMISDYWESPEFTVSSDRRPQMVYDYYGCSKYACVNSNTLH